MDKELFGNIINAFVEAYNKFVKTFKKNGFFLCALAMFLFILLWTLVINPINVNEIIQKSLDNQFQRQMQQQTELKEELIERRYQANDRIGNIMSRILYRYDCNRVMLLEKHNSLQSLGNVDFLYLSASIELINTDNDSVKYMTEDLQRQVVYSLLGDEINKLLHHNKYLYYHDLQQHNRTECRLIRKLIEQNENEVILYPFNNSKNRPLLILVICGDNLNVEDIVSYIDEHSKEITDMLIFE